jgi:hypothetical protein
MQCRKTKRIRNKKAVFVITRSARDGNKQHSALLFIDKNAVGFSISPSVKSSQLLRGFTEANWAEQNPIEYEK